MISAFGVEHGEISKAGFGLSSLGGAIARKTTQAGGALGRRGQANMGAARAMGKPPTPGMSRMKRGLGMAGKQQSALGGRLNRLGAGMAQRPGLTGGIAAGGGAAGVGGGAALGNNRRRF